MISHEGISVLFTHVDEFHRIGVHASGTLRIVSLKLQSVHMKTWVPIRMSKLILSLSPAYAVSISRYSNNNRMQCFSVFHYWGFWRAIGKTLTRKTSAGKSVAEMVPPRRTDSDVITTRLTQTCLRCISPTPIFQQKCDANYFQSSTTGDSDVPLARLLREKPEQVSRSVEWFLPAYIWTPHIMARPMITILFQN